MTQAADPAIPVSKRPAPPKPALVSESTLDAGVEAVLVSSDRPVGEERLAMGLGLVPDMAADNAGGVALVRAAVERLNESYAATGRCFRIERVAGGLRVMTLAALGPVVWGFHESRASSRLSRAALETLAVIAYRQPITRAELEAIRGVSCGEVLRSLMERRLVTIQGRAEELGRPMLYATTREFLDAFGLASIKDLPSHTDLASPAGEPARDAPASSDDATPPPSSTAGPAAQEALP